MTAQDEFKTNQEKRFHEFEAQVKTLVDAGNYREALDLLGEEKNCELLYSYLGDSCTCYSFKITGVCLIQDMRRIWREEGFKAPDWMDRGNRLFDLGDYSGAIAAYSEGIGGNDEDKALYARGCAHRAMGNPYESVEDWDNACDILRKNRAPE